MQAIQTINTNVATVDNGQRVIVDVENRSVFVARVLRGCLALAGRCAPLALLERLERSLLASSYAGIAMWQWMAKPMACVHATPATPAGPAVKPPVGCLGTAITARGGLLSRSLGSLAA